MHDPADDDAGTPGGSADTDEPQARASRSEDETLDALKALTSIQFEELLLRLRVPLEHLPAAGTAQASRALALLRLLRPPAWDPARLQEELARVQIGAGRRPPSIADVGPDPRVYVAKWLSPPRDLSPLQVRLEAAEAPPILLAPATTIWNRRGLMDVPEVESRANEGAMLPLERVVDERPIVVLRGAPGAGKSTACYTLGRRYAEGLLQHRPNAHIPVLVELRHYVRHGKETAAEALERLLARALRDGGVLPPEYVEAAKDGRRFLADGIGEIPLAVFFDGLNEVGATSARDAHDALRQLLDRVRGTTTRVVVTTRRHGAEVRLLGDVEVFDVQPLPADEIRTYLARRLDWPAERVTRLYEEEIGPRLQLVAGNPLALNLLCTILRTDGRVPQSRGELFDAYARGILQREEHEKLGDFGQRHFRPDTKRLALQELAHAMQPSGRTLSERRALEVFENLTDVDDPEALLDELCRNDLLSRSEGDVSFSYHHTFQEYFCAAALLQRHRDGQLDIDAVATDPRWWEPFAMAAGLTRDTRELEALVTRVQAHPPLAGMLLGNCRPGTPVEKRFVERGRLALDAGIRRAVLSTQAIFYLVLAAGVFGVWYAAPRVLVNATWVLKIFGVDPFQGIPMVWIAIAIVFLVLISFSTADGSESWIVRQHDRAVGRAYDLWIEPWLLALYYANSPVAEQVLKDAHARHGAGRAVDVQIRRYLETFSIRSLMEDPETLLAWLDDPDRWELAIVQLGAFYDGGIAARLRDRAARGGTDADVGLAVFAEWLARRPEARDAISVMLADVAGDPACALEVRRAAAHLLTMHDLPAPRLPLTMAEVLSFCAAPFVFLWRSCVTTAILPAVLVVRSRPVARSRAGARLRRWLERWCSNRVLRPGETGLEQVVDTLLAAREAEPADTLLAIALDRYPRHTGLLISRGNLLHSLHRQYHAAAEAYTMALRLKPDSPRLLRDRSRCLRGTGKLDEAIRDARKALRLAPEEASSHMVLVEALLEARRTEEAESVVVKAQGRFPASAGLHWLQGNLLFDGARYAEASQAYSAALKFDLDSAPLVQNRAEALRYAGDLEGAMRDATRAAALEPASGKTWAVMTDVLLDLGKTGQIQSEPEPTSADPFERRWVLETLIRLELVLGEPEKAARHLEDAEDALRSASCTPSPEAREGFLLWHAEIALRLGERRQARAALDALGAAADPVWAGLLAHLTGDEEGAAVQDNPLVERHRRVEALVAAPGNPATPCVIAEMPAHGLTRMARQCALLLEAEIARLEGRPSDVATALREQAHALSAGDERRLDALLFHRLDSAGEAEAEP